MYFIGGRGCLRVKTKPPTKFLPTTMSQNPPALPCRVAAQFNKSLQATRDGALSSASRFTSFGPACLSSGRSPRHEVAFDTAWLDASLDQALRVAAGIPRKHASDGRWPMGHYWQRCEAFPAMEQPWQPQAGGRTRIGGQGQTIERSQASSPRMSYKRLLKAQAKRRAVWLGFSNVTRREQKHCRCTERT